MNKYERIYSKATENGRNASWMDTAIAALAVDIEEYTGIPVTVSGPFGLRAEVMLKSGERYLTICPDFQGEGLQLYYDTGKTTQRHPPLSLGDFNGFNNVQERLPDTLEAIVSLFRHRG